MTNRLAIFALIAMFLAAVAGALAGPQAALGVVALAALAGWRLAR
jgi:hypothetical protein